MAGGMTCIPILQDFVVRRSIIIPLVVARLALLKQNIFDSRDLAGAIGNTRNREQLIQQRCREEVGILNQKYCVNLRKEEGQLVI